MNTDWQWVQLGEISEVISKGTTPTTHGVAFLDSGIPFLRAEDVVGGAVDVTSVKYYVSDKTHDTLLARSKLRPGDFLITIAGSLGRVGYVPLNAPPLNCNQAVAFVRLKPNVIDLDFLLCVFQYEGITKSLLDVQKVGTIGNLNLEQIRVFRIPLPPLTEQKRIASLLARADRLRHLRRTAHDLGESLLQSVFLEMFGDPFRNEKCWERVELTELVRAGDTINYGVVQPGDDFQNGKAIIRVGDLDNLAQNLAILKLIDPKIEANYKRSRIVGDEILIACVGSIGRVALVNEKMKGFNIVRAVARVPANYSLVNRLYLATYLSMPFVQDFFQRETRTVSQPTLNIAQIEETPVLLPPLSLQEEFAGVVARVEQMRARQAESERQVENLFESLLAESFGGVA